MDKQFPIKQRGVDTYMVDFIWHNCQRKKGFQKHTYQKLSDELQEYAAHYPLMSTQELVDWAKMCHPNVSIHAYDSTWRKFMKHIAAHSRDITLVFYIKDHHLYPILDDRLKSIATQTNQGGTDNLWKYMSDMKWPNKSNKIIMYEDLGDDDMEDLIRQKEDKQKENKLTLAYNENHVIILPPETKIEPVITAYIARCNYIVEYLHFDNNGRLDGFMDHKNNMYVLHNEYDIRKSICEKLYSMYKSYDFIWSNQPYTTLASSLFKHMRGCLPQSQYDTKTREVLDDFYTRRGIAVVFYWTQT